MDWMDEVSVRLKKKNQIQYRDEYYEVLGLER